MLRRAVAVVVAAGAATALTACGSVRNDGRQAESNRNHVAERGVAAPVRARSTGQPIPHPSPPAEPWGYCGNIRGASDARSLVAGGEATALVEAQISGRTVRSFHVLAGHVSGFHTLNDDLTVRPGRYLVLLGGAASPYYAALGDYGVYRIDGNHAFQLCAYGQTQPRSGVTDRDRIVHLLQHALRS